MKELRRVKGSKIGEVAYWERHYRIWLACAKCDELRWVICHKDGSLYRTRNLCRRCSNRKPPGVTAFNSLYASYLHRAKEFGYAFMISKLEFKRLANKPCYYCGAEPAAIMTFGKYHDVFVYNGLDRIDNNKGYILSNVVSCCGSCNIGKRGMSQEEFIRLCHRVANKHPRGEEGL